MFPSQSPSFASKQRGSMLVIALVVAVLLLALGLTLSQVISAGASQNAWDYYGTRSYMAAQSGIERSLRDMVNHPSPNCALVNGQVYSFNAEQLEQCNVRIACASATYTNPSGTMSLFKLDSEARCTIGDIATSRAVTVELRVGE